MEELKYIVFGMHPNKSPGADGFIPEFFHKTLDIIKENFLSYMNLLLKTLKVKRY